MFRTSRLIRSALRTRRLPARSEELIARTLELLRTGPGVAMAVHGSIGPVQPVHEAGLRQLFAATFWSE